MRGKCNVIFCYRQEQSPTEVEVVLGCGLALRCHSMPCSLGSVTNSFSGSYGSKMNVKQTIQVELLRHEDRITGVLCLLPINTCSIYIVARI